jgi:NAD(P)-dependent dehydrogenase (short-subunit alcohol dehydrogenase family)
MAEKAASPFDFSGKAVFVAGGTSGINLGIAQAFAATGARLAVLGRSQAKLDAAQDELRKSGGDVAGFSADVRDPAAVAAALQSAHQKFGPIDVLVSGAAGNFPAPVLGMSPNGFKAVVDIDLLGTFNVLRAAHQYLKKPGAVVVNISAPQAEIPTAWQAHVCAAKAGVDMLTRVLAIEWGGDGIRINSVMPGPIEGTEGMARLAPTPESEREVTRGVPLGRFGKKQEVADLVMFLASPWAAYITGAIIPVDGGWSATGSAGLSDILQKAAKR